MTITLTMHTDDRIGADVLTMANGTQFIALRLGDSTVYLPDCDAVTVQAAHKLIEALTAAVQQMRVAAAMEEPAPVTT